MPTTKETAILTAWLLNATDENGWQYVARPVYPSTGLWSVEVFKPPLPSHFVSFRVTTAGGTEFLEEWDYRYNHWRKCPT